MIGHQQFKNGFAGGQNLSGISFHFHSTFDGTNTGRGQNACSGVDHTQTAYAHGSFILQMAQGGYRDAVYSSGVENTRSKRHGHGYAIKDDVDESGR